MMLDMLLPWLYARWEVNALLVVACLWVGLDGIRAHRAGGQVDPRKRGLWLLATCVQCATATWGVAHVDGHEVLRLNMVSVFSVLVLLTVWPRWALGIRWSALEVWVGTFVSCLVVDMTMTVQRALDEGLSAREIVRGVGGAGWADALVIVPLLTLLMYLRIGALELARSQGIGLSNALRSFVDGAQNRYDAQTK